jgi:hypothetical protein
MRAVEWFISSKSSDTLIHLWQTTRCHMREEINLWHWTPASLCSRGKRKCTGISVPRDSRLLVQKNYPKWLVFRAWRLRSESVLRRNDTALIICCEYCPQNFYLLVRSWTFLDFRGILRQIIWVAAISVFAMARKNVNNMLGTRSRRNSSHFSRPCWIILWSYWMSGLLCHQLVLKSCSELWGRG